MSNFKLSELTRQPVELLEPLRLLFEAKISKTFTVAMNSLQRITQSFNVTDVSLFNLT